MSTFARYVVVEFLKVFVLAVTGMTVVLLFIGVGREAVREGLGPGPILKLLPFIVPESMRISLPASALLASCTVFGRMAGENEVVAAKSMGISAWALLAPAFLVAFLISVWTVWINDVAVSWGRPGMHRVVGESIEQIAYSTLRVQRCFGTDRFSITVRDVTDRKLVLPTLTFKVAGGKGAVTVTAREAELRHNRAQGSLSVFLTDATMDAPGDVEGVFMGTYEHVLEWNRRDKRGGHSPSDYPLRELGVETAKQQERLAKLQQRLTAGAAMQLLTGDVESFAHGGRERDRQLHQAQYRLNRLRTEPWRRWANGFSCFFFVIVGAPLSIRWRNSDFVTSFFVVFVPILLVYYPLMAYGVDRAKEGALPQYGVWIGNAACLLWSLWLVRRVLRY